MQPCNDSPRRTQAAADLGQPACTDREKLGEFSQEHLQPPRLLTEADLIAAGYQPGPQFSEILAAPEDAQLETSLLIPPC